MKFKLGGKKTALEAALEHRERADLDPVRLAMITLIALCVAGAVVCFWQAWAVNRDHSVAEHVAKTRAWAAPEVQKVLTALDARIREALNDDALRNHLAAADEEAHGRALARLKQRLPDLVSAEFYPPELSAVMRGDLAKFGYVRADALADARARGGASRIQADRIDNGPWHLALARSITAGDRTLAYVYLLMPLEPLTEVLSQAHTNGGYLDLRQITLRGFGISLYELPGAAGGAASEDALAEIPGTQLAIGGRGVQTFKIGAVLGIASSRNVFLLTAFGIGLLLLPLAAVYGFLYLTRRGESEADELVQAPGPGKQDEKWKPQLARPADWEAGSFRKERRAHAAERTEHGEEPARAERSQRAPSIVVDRSIFRAYDIRGVIGKTLTPPVAKAIGQAIGTRAREQGLNSIAVARDGRLSGPMMATALIDGLQAAGMDVIDIGAVPTPVLYFATYHLNTGSGVMVTGSHNPPDYNGFKIMLGGETLAEDAIQDLYACIAEGRLDVGTGSLKQVDVRGDYIDRITGDIQVERKLKIVLDAGNGIAGVLGPQILEAIGCDVMPLHCDVDGNFPAHHPDPSDPQNLRDLIVAVKQFGADIGIAFDGDGDRLGVVTAHGEIIYPDRLLMLFAQDVLLRNPGAAVIYDVKCSGRLQDVILSAGGSPIMWKTGHSLIKGKMKEVDAELAGEMSGHFFFRERWYGFDDAIYAAARLAEILAVSPLTPEEVFAELPKGVATPELKIQMEEGRQFAFMAKFREMASFPGARVTTIDGVRADYPQGWGLVRCSNTTPSLVLRFEGDDNPVLNHIQDDFRTQLLAVDPQLRLPF